MKTKLTALDKAVYLVERGYFPHDTDVEELAKIIEESTKNIKEPKKIVNDINTVYHDKTVNQS